MGSRYVTRVNSRQTHIVSDFVPRNAGPSMTSRDRMALYFTGARETAWTSNVPQ